MIVVSDTGPLHYLILSGHSELVRSRFHEAIRRLRATNIFSTEEAVEGVLRRHRDRELGRRPVP